MKSRGGGGNNYRTWREGNHDPENPVSRDRHGERKGTGLKKEGNRVEKKTGKPEEKVRAPDVQCE